jgi:aspartate aminotransferase
MVAEFCRDRGLFLIVDEVYREFVYDGRRAESGLQLPGFEKNVIVVDSLSKRYSACGIRLGCLATRNRDVYQAALRMAQGRLSPPGLAQFVAVGMKDLPPTYTASVVSEYQKRRDLLFEGLRGIPGVFLTKPEGAFYFVARLPVEDSEEFARFLLSDFALDGETVMVAPASGFYATPGLGNDEVRIAYVLKEEDLRASIRILGAALEAHGRRPASRERAAAAVPAGPDFAVPAES